jgi:hypothetical protein
MTSSPLNPETGRPGFLFRWLRRLQAWYKVRSFSFKLYIGIILTSIVLFFILTIPVDFIKENIFVILLVLTFVILCLITFAFYELVPQPKGLIESLQDVRKDQLVDSAILKLEMEPPQTWNDMARCTQEAMSIIAMQRRMMPWKRLLKVTIRVVSIIYLLSIYLKALVLSASTEKRFGLNVTSTFWDYSYTSVVAATTFGRGIVQDSDFIDPIHKSLFLMFTTILSVLILGIGINLLASSLDESNFINLLYHAVRTHLESIMGRKSRLKE